MSGGLRRLLSAFGRGPPWTGKHLVPFRGDGHLYTPVVGSYRRRVSGAPSHEPGLSPTDATVLSPPDGPDLPSVRGRGPPRPRLETPRRGRGLPPTSLFGSLPWVN